MFIIYMDWNKIIENEHKKEYMKHLNELIRDQRIHLNIFPQDFDVYNAFHLCSFNNTKVVIIGQDPYHGHGQAHGLSFSVKNNTKLPPSLRNIFKELYNDTSVVRTNCDLSSWAKQGVLLLNNVLTVAEGKPNSHKKIGWQTFTDKIINVLNENKTKLVFILWGKDAQYKARFVDINKHYVIKTNHPSPLSANKGGFFNTKIFSSCNTYLKQTNQIEIDWSL